MTSTVRIIVPLGTREPGGTVTVINPTWTVAIFRALTPLMLKGWTGKDGGVMITQSGEQRWKSNQLILKNEAYSCRNDFHKNLPVIYLYSSSLKKPWIEWLDDSISYVELTKIYRSCTYDIYCFIDMLRRVHLPLFFLFFLLWKQCNFELIWHKISPCFLQTVTNV